MDNPFANKTLTPELLTSYFNFLEQTVQDAEQAIPDAASVNESPFAERRQVSLLATEKTGLPLVEAKVRPDWRSLMNRAVAVPYKLEQVRVLPETGRIEELTGVSSLASFTQHPTWVSRTGHVFPGVALELHLDLEGSTPINALDSGMNENGGLRLAELWYVGGDWDESSDSRGLRSLPVEPEERVQLFAPVMARKLILVLTDPVGVRNVPTAPATTRRIALEVGQKQDEEQDDPRGAWQYLLDAQAPRIYTVEGPLQLEVALAQADGPLMQLDCEVEEQSETGELLDLGNSTRYVQWQDYSSGIEAMNLVLDPRRLWSRTNYPRDGIGIPLTKGTYHLCLSSAGCGGWTTQQGPVSSRTIWSKLLWAWWDDGEEHNCLTTDRELKDDSDIFNVSDPSLADEFFSFTIKRDTTVWFYLPASREPAHSFPIHAVLTSDNQRTSTAIYRPGEWVEFKVDTYTPTRSIPLRNTVQLDGTGNPVDSVFLDLSSCGQPSRAWVYVKEDGRWHFVQELLVADQQRFQVNVNRARATRLRVFFPPVPDALPTWIRAGGPWPQRLSVQEPSILEIGPEIEEGSLLTGRQVWKRGMYVMAFEDAGQLTQANDPDYPGALTHARNFQLNPLDGPMSVDLDKGRLLAPGAVLIDDLNPSTAGDGLLENWPTEAHDFEFEYISGKRASIAPVIELSTNPATPDTFGLRLVIHLIIENGNIKFDLTAGSLSVAFTDSATVQPGWHRLRLIQYYPWKFMLYHWRDGAWFGLGFFDLHNQAGSWSTIAATWTGANLAAEVVPVKRLHQSYWVRKTSLRKLITYNVYTWDPLPAVSDGVLPHKMQMVGVVAKDQHAVYVMTQKSLDGLPWGDEMPYTYASSKDYQEVNKDGALMRSIPVWLPPDSGDVNASFARYTAQWRKPLMETGGFSDPLYRCGMKQVAGTSTIEDSEWSPTGAGAILTPEELGPAQDWMVDLDLRFDMALAHSAGKDSGLSIRFADGSARWLELTISRPVYSYTDTTWYNSNTSAQNIIKTTAQIFYTLRAYNNDGSSAGTAFSFIDPVAAATSGAWRIILCKGLLSVFRKDAGGIYQPVVGFKSDTASDGNPLVTASGLTPVIGYRNTNPSHWLPANLEQSVVQLAGNLDRRAFGTNLKVYAYSRDDHRLRVTRAADGAVTQDMADPSFVFDANGAITHHYFNGTMTASPSTWDSLSLVDNEKLFWVQLLGREGNLAASEAVLRLPNYPFLPDPATARALQRVVEGADGLLQIFDGSRKLVLRKAKTGGKWLLDKAVSFPLTAGSTLWTLGGEYRLYSVPQRFIHLSKVTMALDGAPTLRSAQTRYSLEWAGKVRKVLPAPQQTARGVSFPLERGDGGMMELHLDPPCSYALSATPSAANLKTAGITVVDADQVLTCGTDFIWHHETGADRLELLGDGFGSPRLFYPVVSMSRAASYDLTQSDWNYARLSRQVTNASLIGLTANVFPPPDWLWLQGKPRARRGDGAFVTGRVANYVLRAWIDGRFILDITDYYDGHTPATSSKQLSCWIDGKTLHFSQPLTGKLDLVWTSLPEKVRLVARIEQPAGLVRCWPRFTARTLAAYYKPNRR